MSAADSGLSAARVGLIAAAVLTSGGMFDDALARNSEGCAAPAASRIASIAEHRGAVSLLAAARRLASDRAQSGSDAGEVRPAAGRGALLSSTELQARIARYRVGPPQQRLQDSLASATAAASPTHCRRGG